MRFEEDMAAKVVDKMTPRERLITVKEDDDLSVAKKLLNKHRLERVVVIDDNDELRGLITVKDIQKATTHPNATKDAHGQLRVGAAVGVGPENDERVRLLAQAGVKRAYGIVGDALDPAVHPITKRDVLARFIDTFGIDYLVYGSDSSFLPRGYIMPYLEEWMEICAQLRLSQAETAALFYGNAEKLLLKK